MLRLLLVVLSATSLLLSTVWPAPSAHADDSVYWVDVRTPEEYQQGHLPGTLNIEYQNIDVGLQALGVEHDAVIYLHCRSGRRSGIALETLRSLGYTNAVNLGGYEEARNYQASHRKQGAE